MKTIFSVLLFIIYIPLLSWGQTAPNEIKSLIPFKTGISVIEVKEILYSNPSKYEYIEEKKFNNMMVVKVKSNEFLDYYNISYYYCQFNLYFNDNGQLRDIYLRIGLKANEIYKANEIFLQGCAILKKQFNSQSPIDLIQERGDNSKTFEQGKSFYNKAKNGKYNLKDFFAIVKTDDVDFWCDIEEEVCESKLGVVFFYGSYGGTYPALLKD